MPSSWSLILFTCDGKQWRCFLAICFAMHKKLLTACAFTDYIVQSVHIIEIRTLFTIFFASRYVCLCIHVHNDLLSLGDTAFSCGHASFAAYIEVLGAHFCVIAWLVFVDAWVSWLMLVGTCASWLMSLAHAYEAETAGTYTVSFRWDFTQLMSDW